MLNIIVSIFEVESEGFQAITEFRNNREIGESFMSEAILVKKDKGTYEILDSYDTGEVTASDTVTGGLLGMCIGVLGGPIGMLLGGSIGALAGAGVDAADASGNMSLLEQMIGKLGDDTLALIALAYEEDESLFDDVLSKYDTIIARFDAAVIEHEVEKAKEMEKEMENMAKLEVRRQKKQEHQAKVEERRNKMKADFAAFKETHKKDKVEE